MSLAETQNVQIAAAFIALSGVVLSVFISAILSWYQARKAAANLKMELAHKYNEHLYLKRLETYPPLYFILSELGKTLLDDNLKYADFSSSLNEINEWDSKNAVYVSASMIALLLDIRGKLGSFRFESDAENPTQEDRDLIFESSLRLEQALRNEIGVYVAGDYHNAPVSRGALHTWEYKQALKSQSDTDARHA